jgi:branched-chain amino acid transport system ATP-binding protein
VADVELEDPSAPPDAPAILRAEHLVKEFGGLVAVDDVSIEVPERAIVSIIGPNGAGKTTVFNMLTGLYKPTAGRIVLAGRDVTRSRPDKITARGMARTFQNIRLFGAMTALDNVMVGRHSRLKSGAVRAVLRPPPAVERLMSGVGDRAPEAMRWLLVPKVVREERESRARARELLSYVGLRDELHDQVASHLSYGDQRRVEIARALASEPKILLLDEPTAGMNPQESAGLTGFMRQLRAELGLTILLIEHDMKVVMDVSERITVLDHGVKIAEGPPDEVRSNERVIEAYLGAPQ